MLFRLNLVFAKVHRSSFNSDQAIVHQNMWWRPCTKPSNQSPYIDSLACCLKRIPNANSDWNEPRCWHSAVSAFIFPCCDMKSINQTSELVAFQSQSNHSNIQLIVQYYACLFGKYSLKSWITSILHKGFGLFICVCVCSICIGTFRRSSYSRMLNAPVDCTVFMFSI